MGQCATAQPVARPQAFDHVFSSFGEPTQVHYVANYQVQGQQHRLEVWRDGVRRLRRLSDQRLETFVQRGEDGTDFTVVVLDKERKIRTDISRSNLARIGQFVDWFGLAHGLVQPQGDYELSRTQAPLLATTPHFSCQWWDLLQKTQTSHICWSSDYRLPVQIVSQDNVLLWSLTFLDTNALSDKDFVVDDAGYVRSDADQDMQAD